MIALTPIFFAPDWPRCAPSHRSDPAPAVSRGRTSCSTSCHRRADAGVALIALAALNVVLPLRHYLADGNVRFNDDGYYLSWRVMLTERTGFLAVRRDRPGDRRDVAGPTRRRPRRVAGRPGARSDPTSRSTTAHLVAADFARRRAIPMSRCGPTRGWRSTADRASVGSTRPSTSPPSIVGRRRRVTSCRSRRPALRR